MQRAYRADGRYDETIAAYKARLKADFFRWRVQFARRWNPAITPDDLRALWDAQDGRCGLTGRELVPEAGDANGLADDGPQLDHIVPIARGGTHDLSNLRWVCAAANRAKRDLLDDEFFALCRSVVRSYIIREGLEPPAPIV